VRPTNPINQAMLAPGGREAVGGGEFEQYRLQAILAVYNLARRAAGGEGLWEVTRDRKRGGGKLNSNYAESKGSLSKISAERGGGRHRRRHRRAPIGAALC